MDLSALESLTSAMEMKIRACTLLHQNQDVVFLAEDTKLLRPFLGSLQRDPLLRKLKHRRTKE